jgi:putative glutamine amidotransferase
VTEGPTPLSRKPLIAMSGRRWKGSEIGSGLPDNFADIPVDLHIGSYADSVTAAGGVPVFTACTPSAVEVLDYVDGLVLTGGSDVDPRRYGEEPHPKVYGVDAERDEIEIALVHRALALGRPILAICRGLQVLNVALGGSLVQHLEGKDYHGAWDVAPHELTHQITITAGSQLHRAFGESCVVNSLHHQAVATLGQGLVATAFADDGTIEGAELPGHPVLAVQWHPELVLAHPDPSFVWLINTARS